MATEVGGSFTTLPCSEQNRSPFGVGTGRIEVPMYK